jgi:hypothetical protein
MAEEAEIDSKAEKAKKAKASKIEHESRLRVVMEWILEDYIYADMRKSAVAKWEISERQAERYIADAYKLCSESISKNIEQKKGYYISRKRKLIRDMDPSEKKTAAGVTAINKILDTMAEIEGIKTKSETPIENNITLKIGYGPKNAED